MDMALTERKVTLTHLFSQPLSTTYGVARRLALPRQQRSVQSAPPGPCPTHLSEGTVLKKCGRLDS